MTPRWTPWGAIKEFVGLVLVEPIREGRLQPRGWPAGFAAIGLVTLVLYIAGAALILGAGWYRNLDTLIIMSGDALPRTATIPLSALLCWILGLAMAGFLHMHPAIRILGWAIVSVSILPFAAIGVANPAAPVLVFAAIGALAVLIAVRWCGRPRWWEFVICVAIVTIAIEGSLTGITFADQLQPDLRSAVLYLSVAITTVFAAPMYVLAGAAIAQIAVTAAESAAALLRDDTPSKIWVAAIALVIVARGIQMWFEFATGWEFMEPRLLGTVVYLTAVALLAGPLWILGRHSPRALGRPGDLVEVWSPWLYPLALVLVGLLMITQFASSINLTLGSFDVRSDPLQAIGSLADFIPGRFSGFRMIGCILLLPAAFWAAYKGRLLLATLIASFCVGIGLDWVMNISDLFIGYSNTLLSATVTVLALLVLGWLALRRSLTRVRVGGVLTALLLSFIYPYRDVLDEPLSAVVGFSGIAVILFGLIWRILTDGAFTRRDSKAFPRAGRVLVFFATALIAVTGMAWDAIAGGRSALNGEGEAALGDLYLGLPLFITAAIAALITAVRPPARTDAAEFPPPPGPAPHVPGAYGPVAAPHGHDRMAAPPRPTVPRWPPPPPTGRFGG